MTTLWQLTFLQYKTIPNKELNDYSNKERLTAKAVMDLLNYMIKTTINTLIQIMNMIQERISLGVSQAKYYSIQVDSTRDTAFIDQFSINIRYVLQGLICERLSVVPSNDGTGQGLF